MSQEEPFVEVPISGMHCANCALGIEKHLNHLGLSDARVSIATESAHVRPTSEWPLAKISEAITSLGYTIPLQPGLNSDAHHEHNRSSFFSEGMLVFISAIFTAPFLVHMFFDVPLLHEPAIQAACAFIACGIGLRNFIPSAISSIKSGVPNMEVLISIGILASLGYSVYGWIIGEAHSFDFFESAATISSLVLIGGWLEHRASSKARSSIEELANLQPRNAVRVRGEERETVAASALAIDDVIAVNSGDRFACDGEVISGQAAVDEAIATGESILQNKTQGTPVIAGTIVMQGSVLVRVTAPESKSFVASMVQLVRRAQIEKPPISRTADKIAAVFVPIILGLALVTIVGSLMFGLPIGEAITRGVAVLVIACPCALGLATPAAVMIGISRAARLNILFRSGIGLEAFAGIEAIAFDKTGTLSTGVSAIAFLPTDKTTLDEAKRIAKGLENHSSHPIAKQIVKFCGDVSPLVFDSVKEEIGFGLRGSLQNDEYFIGRDGRFPNQTVLLKNGLLLAAINISETLRPGAQEALQYFTDNKITRSMISGDTQARCEDLPIPKGLINSIQGNQSPQQKQHIITALNKRVAFVGDGVNDAPVLASATLGISLGEASSVAINTADIVILGGSLAPLSTAHKIARATLKTIRENLFWAFSYNIVAIPVAMSGLLNPAWAALAMGFSDVILIINSLRLQLKRF